MSDVRNQGACSIALTMPKQDTRGANHRLLIVLCKRRGSTMINLINVEAIQTIALTILAAFGLATPATRCS
jgi:hypothetical protein